MHDITPFRNILKLLKGRVTDSLMLLNFKIETVDFIDILINHNFCKTINLSNIEWKESKDIEDIKIDSNLEWSITTISLCSPVNMNRSHFKKLIKKLSMINSLKKSLKWFIMEDWPFDNKKAKDIFERYEFKIDELEF